MLFKNRERIDEQLKTIVQSETMLHRRAIDVAEEAGSMTDGVLVNLCSRRNDTPRIMLHGIGLASEGK